MVMKKNVQSAFVQSADYGWCETDRPGKNAHEIGRTYENDTTNGETVRPDYLLEPEMRDFTKYFFDIFKLPLPQAESIYRGRSQDLLFISNHGLVVKTGDIDVVDLIHPAMIQPLFWLPHEETDHVIALYPGVQLLKQMGFNSHANEAYTKKTKKFLDETHQKSLDIDTIENLGLINDTPIIIDTEQLFFGTDSEMSPANESVIHQRRDRKKQAYATYIEAGYAPHQAIRQTMVELYNDHPQFKEWIRAYDFHHPLRAQIHDAINAGNSELKSQKLSMLYKRCNRLVQQPEKIQDHRWHVSRLTKKGAPVWTKEDCAITELALYSPWTGNLKDNALKTTVTIPALQLR